MAEIVIKLVNGELAGKTMQGINKELTAAHLAFKKAEIGTKEWIAANDKLEKVKQLQGDMKKQIEGTATASDMLKKSWNSLPGAQFFNQISSSIGMMKGGVGGLVSQFGVLKAAIAATGLGLLVIVIGSVINYLSKLESVTNMVKGAWDGLTAAFNVFTKAVATMDFSNLGDKMATAAKEAYNLVDAFDALEDQARDLSLSNDEAGKTIDQLLLKSKNVSLSYQERLDILDKVDDVEEKQHNKRLAYANEYLAAVQREVDNAERQNEANDELKDKLVEAKRAVIAAERETLVLQEKIENRRSALLEKQQAERDKDAAKREKENEKFLKDQEKFYEQLHQLQEKEELFQENRRAANLEKEKQSIKTGMLAALDSIKKQTDASKEAQAEKKAIADAEIAIQQESHAVFNEGINSVVSLLASDVASRKKYANEIKTLQVGQVAVNGITEVSEIAKTFATLGPIGQILAAFRIAFAVARTAAGINRINAQKFELGGPVSGPRHSAGGVPIEAEGGEFIFSRKAVRSIGMNTLNAINRRLTFADGGAVPSNPFASSGSAASPAAGGGSAGADPFAALGRLENTIVELTAAMDRRFDRIQVTNNLQETEKGLATLNQLRNEADV